MMTVKELFDWAMENGIENAEIEISYNDARCYSDTREIFEDEITVKFENYKTKIII